MCRHYIPIAWSEPTRRTCWSEARSPPAAPENGTTPSNSGQWIDAVAIDPHAGYLRGILSALPDVTVTVDHFHAIKLANAMVDDVRRRTQQSTLGRRGHKDDPLYRTRRLMTRGWERLSARQQEKLFAALAEGDPDGETAASILGKELLREVYAAANIQRARWKLVHFYEHVAWAEVPELTRLATTVSRWEQEILNFHVTRISTGPVEAQNLVTEKIRRVSVYRPSTAGCPEVHHSRRDESDTGITTGVGGDR